MKLKYIAGGCAAAGLIWVVSRITQPYAFFHPYYITQGPLEMCALSILFYLFGWWRGYVEGARGGPKGRLVGLSPRINADLRG